MLNSNEVPISFDAKSDKLALASLYNLKPLVLYANSDGTKIFLIGCHDIKNHTFVLDRWYLKVPFKEYKIADETILPHKVEIVERNSLRAKDFYKTESFDPDSHKFNPKHYIQSQQF